MTGTGLVGAIVLAAGNGARMGTPKVRMKAGGVYFIERITDAVAAAGVTDLICILRPADTDWIADTFPNLPVAVNPSPESGMLSSVQVGLAHFAGKQKVILIPVDHPLVAPATYELLLHKSALRPEAVIIPSLNRQAGHPIVIPRNLFARILRADKGLRLKDVLHGTGSEICYTACRDIGILGNLNSPADAARFNTAVER